MIENNFHRWAEKKEVNDKMEPEEVILEETEEEIVITPFVPTMTSYDRFWRHHNDIKRYKYFKK